MTDRSYTEQEKRHGVRVYLLCGSFVKAGVELGIPHQTITSWKFNNREWWDRTCNELITEIEGEYRPGWVRVMGKAVEALEERLENGNTVLTKAGQTRIPVPAREVAVIAGIAADKLKQFGLMAPAAKISSEDRQRELRQIAQADRQAREAPKSVQ